MVECIVINVRYLSSPSSVRIAVLEMHNPPVNGLGHALRSALVAALDRVESESDTDAIALTGAGKLFCGGADVREFGTEASTASPDLRQVLARVFACEKPTTAVINGAALGGGLELAMACNYRLAVPGASLALPEVKLGLIPGAWGTQLAPRLVGVGHALRLVTRGDAVSGASAAELGLVDALASDELDSSIVAFVEARMGRDTHPDTRLRVPPDVGALQLDWMQRAALELAQDFPGCPAPQAGVEAVGLALELPFDEAVLRERALFVQLMKSPESSALRYVFFAERDCARIPGVKLPPAGTRGGVPVAADAPHYSDLPGATAVQAGSDAVRLETLAKGGRGDVSWLDCALRAADQMAAVGMTVFLRGGVPACVEVRVGGDAGAAALAQAFAIARRINPVVVASGAATGASTLVPLLEAGNADGRAGLEAFRLGAEAAVVNGGLYRLSDADVVAVHLGLMPRYLGGPVYQHSLSSASAQEVSS